MNNSKRVILAWLVGSTAWQLAAQTVAPVATRSADEETVTLSPFEVSTTRDTGYQATDTLAGTRIRTELRDVGSAISVATKEFMRDIGATDNQSLLQYMTSTEVGGPQGNFAGLGNDSMLDDANARLRPNGNTRVRGLDSADNTRDFYLTDIPWDGYNISRVDIQRGANSILFGNGSGAGIINNATDQATLGKNSAVVEGKAGSFGSYRGSFNLNRDLIPKELALRVATLFDKKYYRQDPAYNEDKRYYGALRWEPRFLARGSARTSVKMSYENGDIDANRPRTTTPYDSISPWFLKTAQQMKTPDGVLLGVLRPMISHAGYDPFVTGISAADRATLIAANPSLATRQDIGAGVAFAANNPYSEAWLGRSTGPGISGGWDGFGAVFGDPASGTMSYYLPRTPTPFLYNAINSAGVRDGNINGLRAPENNRGIVRLDQYSILGVGGRLTENDGFLYERQGVYRATSITDTSIYDFYNKLLDGPNKKEAQKFNAFNVSLDQTFFHGKAGFQAALDQQNNSTFQKNFLGNQTTIVLDVYKYLPIALLNPGTGLMEPVLNPNFGRPFVASRAGGSRSKTDRETWRITPFVDLDAKTLMKSDNLLTKILGRHTITGLAEGTKATSSGSNFSRYALAGNDAALLWGPNQPLGNQRNITTLNYLGPSLTTASSLAGAGLSNITALQQIRNGAAWYFDSTYRSGAPAASAAWPEGATLGLAPNQNGITAVTSLFQAENPANYNGWSTTANRNIDVINADFGDEGALTTSGYLRRDQTKSWALVDQWALLNRHIVVTAGIREDKIDAYRAGPSTVDSALRTGSRPTIGATGAVDFDASFELPGSPSQTFESERLKTYSVVAHSPAFINQHLPWGLRLSAFYNQSDNFKPVARVGVLGDPIAPPTGKTKDYGVVISALDGKVSLRINRYDTSVQNASLADNQVLTTTGDEVDRGIQFALAIQRHGGGAGSGNYALPMVVGGVTQLNPDGSTRLSAYQPLGGSSTTWTLADWVAADALAQSHAKAFLDATLNETKFLNAWNIHPENWRDNTSNFGLRHDNPGGAAVTGDTHSTGTEFELFIRPTNNWNIAMNAAHTHAQRLALAGSLSAWIENRWALLAGPAGDMRWFGGGSNNGTGSTDFGRVRVGRNMWRWYQSYRAQEGNDVPELRPWRFNVVTNYNFTGRFGGERLKGAFVGAAYRWQDRNIIGYSVKEVTPALGSANPAIGAFDIDKPYYGPAEKAVDLWAGYQRKIFKNIGWRVQLNVSNAFDKVHLVPINTNPDGSGASYRIAEGATWVLSSRFEF